MAYTPINWAENLKVDATKLDKMDNQIDTNESRITTNENDIETTSILTGTASNGSTLPLPSGFTESQCSFFVSPRKISMPFEAIRKIHCYATGRTVTAIETYNRGGSIHGMTFSVNYLVIGVKKLN